ncbi:MAG: hypothetical protein C0467_14930 [Planctomycetaceae bacterium]|nr:hypothetical protein [Planctomycetaceae bacterium]
MKRVLSICVVLSFAACNRQAPEAVPEVVIVAPIDDGSIPPPRPSTRRLPTNAIADGVKYLIAHQSEDGAWRSDVYATFKDGTALTPFAITALQDASDAGLHSPAADAAIKKGIAWLAKLSRKDGTIDPGPDGLDYPLYTATLAIKVYSHVSAHDFLVARDGWVKYLKERQLTEKLGWKPGDKQFGGWGYCRVIPKKPEPNVISPPLIESNLSATLFALDALKTAGELDASTAKAAVIFVRSCQNWPRPGPLEGPTASAIVRDGGFHFIYADPTRNKAGVGASETPEIRYFHSYGSTTSDGFRALALCCFPEDADRRDDAKYWLISHFNADTHPGKYVPAHEPNREAVYYYYAASVAKAFRDHMVTLPDDRDWADELSRELIRRQKPDGSWVNPIELVRENDPIVATCNAISALATCNLSRP